uniref:Secreted protein n=1 Tax=Achlya hypogyna TaxID=1202772 RepID=A0A0A7CML4_ACHHY|nr:secreted protein [Achlya hypogyna]
MKIGTLLFFAALSAAAATQFIQDDAGDVFLEQVPAGLARRRLRTADDDGDVVFVVAKHKHSNHYGGRKRYVLLETESTLDQEVESNDDAYLDDDTFLENDNMGETELEEEQYDSDDFLEDYEDDAYGGPAPAPAYPQPSPAPAYKQPSPAPASYDKKPSTGYLKPTHEQPSSKYSKPTSSYKKPSPAPKKPSYFKPTSKKPTSSYKKPTPAPVYKHPTPAPVYKHPTPAPVYKEPTPAPAYNQPTPAPAYKEPASKPATSYGATTSSYGAAHLVWLDGNALLESYAKKPAKKQPAKKQPAKKQPTSYLRPSHHALLSDDDLALLEAHHHHPAVFATDDEPNDDALLEMDDGDWIIAQNQHDNVYIGADTPTTADDDEDDNVAVTGTKGLSAKSARTTNFFGGGELMSVEEIEREGADLFMASRKKRTGRKQARVLDGTDGTTGPSGGFGGRAVKTDYFGRRQSQGPSSAFNPASVVQTFFLSSARANDNGNDNEAPNEDYVDAQEYEYPQETGPSDDVWANWDPNN